MTERQALKLKDIFFRIKQFYYGVSDKPLSAANMTAGEATEYVTALKEAERTLFADTEGKRLEEDADGMLLTLCAEIRAALTDKNFRLAGDLSALGVRLIGVYTFPYMTRRDFVKKCLLPLREKHEIPLFLAEEAAFLSGAHLPFRLSPAFSSGEGHYYEDDADEALRVSHPVIYALFVFFGILLFAGSIVGFGVLAGVGLSLSSPWLILGYLASAAFGVGLYSLLMSLVHQYMGHTLTGILAIGGALLMALSLFLAL